MNIQNHNLQASLAKLTIRTNGSVVAPPNRSGIGGENV